MKHYISKSQCKLCILLLKYVPIVCVVLMLLHIIFSLLGFNLCISEMLVSRYNKPKIPNKLTRLEACRHLRVSETKFNMLRRKGLISEGTKKAGDVRK